MAALLDASVLFALAWPHHIHHEVAHGWFATRSAEGWATCSMTQNAFLRLSSNPGIHPEACSPIEAISALRGFTNHPDHSFLADDLEPVASPVFSNLQIVGYRQITDAHLLTLAVRHDGLFVTLDRRVGHLVPVRSGLAKYLVLLPEE